MLSSPADVLLLLGGVLSAAFVLFLPLELWRLRRQGRLTWAYVREMLASASPLIPTLLVSGVVMAFIGGLYAGAAALAPWSIPTGVGTALACLVLVDFLYYWDHRCGHRIALLWAASHSVHHSSPQFDQTTGFRISFLDGFISPWFYLPAVLIGFDPLLVLACFGVILGYQQWLHTETIGRLGWLDRWFNTPSNHRVHHGVQDAYLDRNYGAIQMVWDRLFGTYAAEGTGEGEAPRYGLVHPIGGSDPILVHTAGLIQLAHALRPVRGVWRRLALLVRPPGAPAGSASP